MRRPDLHQVHSRIRIAAETNAEELDLSLLGLTEIPEDLYELSGLTSLNLSHNHLGDVDVRAITSLTKLVKLNLGTNQIGPSGAQALTALTSLRSLWLSDNEIGDTGARAIATMKSLTDVNLGATSNKISVHGARAIATMANLASLSLRGNKIGADGAQAIAAMTNLTSLDLTGSEIGASGARAIASLNGLARLDIGYNHIGDDGAQAIASLTNLTSLDLGVNRISDDGAGALAALTNLVVLYLGGNLIGDNGVLAVAALKKLEFLDLVGNRIGSEGVRALAALTNLNYLSLGRNHTEDAFVWYLFAGWTPRELFEYQTAANKAIDLSPLLALTKLEGLRCSESRLELPIPAFWMMPSLKSLVLDGCTLPGVPREVLSRDALTSCLESLQAHFKDLEAGEHEIADIKFMIIGNGRVGKTQICRRLRGLAYDETVCSTHGIQVSSTPIALTPPETITLKIWDFGGQDIYHGTHALFLKSRSLFAIVWTPTTEKPNLDEHDDFRNQPLPYWLTYVRKFGGLDSPILVIQAQCDQLGQENLRPPVPDEQLVSFPFKKLLHYSAKTDRGRVALDEALADAVRWLQSKHGRDKIGNGRAEVKARLEKRYSKGKKIISQTEFRTLCKRVGNINSPSLLLEYLHNIGTVFYRQGLFGDAIILDQAWALEAIYAVFDRESKAFRNIERYGGRFRRSDLAQWVWQKHGKEEQQLFLNLMQQCGICFVIREGDEASGIEPIYVAPDLLPKRDDAQVESALKERWYPGEGIDEIRIFYELLPTGLMRTVITKIGEKAGIAGEYWRDGFYFYDERKNSRALVEQRRTGGWAGEIVVQTKGAEAEALLDEILRFMDDRHALIGAYPSARIQKLQEAREVPLEGTVAPTPPSIKPGYEPSPGRKWAISYAWGDNASDDGHEREVQVDEFCTKAAAKGITVLRDKTTMHYGDRISQFMERIGGSDRIFIFLSDKYLRSAFCMHELFDVWRNCRADGAEFIKRTRVYLLPGANIRTFSERAAYVRYWREQLEAMEEEVARDGLGALAQADLADYRHMQDFVSKTPDMLRLVLDVLSPRSFEDFLKYSLD